MIHWTYWTYCGDIWRYLEICHFGFATFSGTGRAKQSNVTCGVTPLCSLPELLTNPCDLVAGSYEVQPGFVHHHFSTILIHVFPNVEAAGHAETKLGVDFSRFM